MSDILDSEASLAEFIERFLAGTLPKEVFTHRAHVAMAAWHLLTYPLDEATQRIREAIPRFNVSVGGQNTDTGGYHETLTILWIRLVNAHLAAQARGVLLERVRDVTEYFAAQRDVFRQYYSFDVVKSVEARRSWIPPDLKELP
ncbi:MAG: hypothetical protein U0Q16_28540 [Bryobacteraceae bacterium]